MILAVLEPLLQGMFTVGVVLAGILLALFFFLGYERLARRSLERKYVDLEIHGEPQIGDVVLTYNTYHGFITWLTQTPHDVVLPPDDARKLLKRLLCFNCTWGLLTFAVLLIPPFAIISYFAQRRSIADQEANGIMMLSSPAISSGILGRMDREIIRSPSLFHRVVGWIVAGACGLFAAFGIVCLVRLEFGGLLGGVVLAAITGWTARDCLRKGRPGK